MFRFGINDLSRALLDKVRKMLEEIQIPAA